MARFDSRAGGRDVLDEVVRICDDALRDKRYPGFERETVQGIFEDLLKLRTRVNDKLCSLESRGWI